MLDNHSGFGFESCRIQISVHIFVLLWIFLTLYYVNQEQYLFTSSLRSLLKEFRLSCMDFQFHQHSIQPALFSSYLRRRMSVFMICWSKSSLRSLKLEFVKSLLLQFILPVCFQSHIHFHFFSSLSWVDVNFLFPLNCVYS